MFQPFSRTHGRRSTAVSGSRGASDQVEPGAGVCWKGQCWKSGNVCWLGEHFTLPAGRENKTGLSEQHLHKPLRGAEDLSTLQGNKSASFRTNTLFYYVHRGPFAPRWLSLPERKPFPVAPKSPGLLFVTAASAQEVWKAVLRPTLGSKLTLRGLVFFLLEVPKVSERGWASTPSLPGGCGRSPAHGAPLTSLTHPSP